MPTSRWPAFRHRSFVLYWLARFASTFAVQITSVAVGWQVYDITRDPLDLGLVGLIQFIPALLLVLVTGTAADRFGRRTIMAVTMLAEAACAVGLFLLTLRGLDVVWPIFILLGFFGVARAFFNPAANSLIANIVPPEDLPNAIAINTSAWQVASVVGPVAGGLLYGLSAETAYGVALILFATGSALIACVPKPPKKAPGKAIEFGVIVGGFRYIWRNPIVLGAISLDLFAVLLGGAVALMPVYARDILVLGPWGLGLLRAAPGVGAVAVGLYLAFHPIRDHAGVILLVFVAGFGLATTAFGLSTTAWLSILALTLVGGCDMVSVYVREILIQLWTPDELRGRVNAVHMTFVGASNELGEFRAGVMASLIGTVAAVSLGGIATVGIAALWARLFPDLRDIRSLDGPDRAMES